MRLPRDLSGSDLIRSLQLFGYVITRQSGSHIRLTTQQNGEHHITYLITPRCASARLRLSCSMSPSTLASTAMN